MVKTALILGGTGRFGRNMAEAFWNAGWSVHLFDRRSGDLMQSARGADVIVNGWNPPYPQWEAELPALTQQVIKAARASGATVILPGNVYVFGKDAPQSFGAETPHGATNPLGRLRIDMEHAYRAAGIPVILLRCGDFIDTEASGNWFDRIMTAKMSRGGPFVYPGPLDRLHAWAYLPDVGRAAVALAEKRTDLPRFSDIPFPGYGLTGRELGQALQTALGQPVETRRMSWLPLLLAAPFWPMGRKLVEMRYLWFNPHRLDATLFNRLLPDFRETPVEDALRTALPRLSSKQEQEQTVMA